MYVSDRTDWCCVWEVINIRHRRSSACATAGSTLLWTAHWWDDRNLRISEQTDCNSRLCITTHHIINYSVSASLTLLEWYKLLPQMTLQHFLLENPYRDHPPNPVNCSLYKCIPMSKMYLKNYTKHFYYGYKNIQLTTKRWELNSFKKVSYSTTESNSINRIQQQITYGVLPN